MRKKICALLLSSLMVVSMVSCSNKTDNVENNNGQNVENVESVTPAVSAKDITDAVINGGYIRMPGEIDETLAVDMFRLNLENIEEYSIIEAQISQNIGTLIVAKAKEGKVEDVKANIEAFKTSKLEGHNYPEHAEAFERAKVEVVGNIVYYGVFAQDVEAEALKTIADMLK